MTLQFAELRKFYSHNHSSPTEFFLNPFTETLFLPNWLWPQDSFPNKRIPFKKPHSNCDNLKDKIKQWFQALDFKSKRNTLIVKDRDFIESLCYFLGSYNPRNLYNMKKRKSVKSIEMPEEKPLIQNGVNLLLDNLEVAFLQEPVLHLSKDSQKFVSNELIKWMEIITNQKLKETQNPQENPLWFSSATFHKLESFIVNEFEKAIIKGYFNRDQIQSNYLNEIKEFCQTQKEPLKNKNVEAELLNFPLRKTAQLSLKEINAKLLEMKDVENFYEKEKQKLMQKLFEQQIEGSEQESAKKKKRRIRKKFKVNDQTEEKSPKEQSCKKTTKKGASTNVSPQKLNKGKTFIVEEEQTQEEEKIELMINDDISQISKCEDSEFHETDVTFQKYFENQDKMSGPQSSQKSVKKIQESLPQEEIKTTSANSQMEIEGSPQKIVQKMTESLVENQLERSEQESRKLGNMKQKKKSKKDKVVEGLQENLLKTIRNNAFTEFIDTISIESNNLYNYKLSAYQFIVFFISSLLPTTNITLFGSNAVGLSLASSDIDIMISSQRWNSMSDIREVLYHIGSEISKMGWVIDFRLILNAKVPVLKLFIDPKIDYFEHSPLKYAAQTSLTESIVIKADIIVNVEGERKIGCDSTLLMKEWLTDHPQLQRIILFFKYVLWYYGLNENYKGGICSYCLFLMVVSCLFNKIEALKSGEKSISQVLEDDDEGTYIIEILKYYSETFNSEKDEIFFTQDLKGSRGIKIKEKKEDPANLKRTLSLKIVDPINGEYIESSFSQFQQIQQLFSMMLVECMKLDDESKRFISQNQEITDEFSKFYQSLSQGQSGFNVITKANESSSESKGKRLVKKIFGKIKKVDSLKYSVKEIVGIGFKIGIENWMSNGSGQGDERLRI